MKLFGPEVKDVYFNPVAQAFEGTVRHRSLRGWEEFRARAYLPIHTPHYEVCSALIKFAERREADMRLKSLDNVVPFERSESATR